MTKQTYFYQFLEPISKELAFVARELEYSIFSSPRTMLTHARVFVETILQKVISVEQLQDGDYTNLKKRLDLLDDNGYLTADVRDALHHVRQIGNKAAHDARMFRYSEALYSWERVYTIVKWYVEVYGPVEIIVPSYQDPTPQQQQAYDISELEVRLQSMEQLLTSSVQKIVDEQMHTEVAATTESVQAGLELPGFTPIRSLSYRGEQLEVPYFLRDAFLLPQRFNKSETFLIRLGAVQQARIISELPTDLEGLHTHVKRYNDKNDETLFNELKLFIEEEKVRRKLTVERPGELFFFYKDQHIVVTESLSQIPLTTDQFTGIPSLLRQLNEDQIMTVGQLPYELVILAKYDHVGIGTVENLFNQLRGKQKAIL
ncbi:DUF4145 domain-containing protein [Aquibacillus sediminis]|uniref:DUF4145 domain-containing protein n=1 Tax=Aquibacillus sediminis TaxID=2574734 RepID=UPI001109B1DB|nr:DUF4145 domain-containing protein [Aquibacillus sediminis]